MNMKPVLIALCCTIGLTSGVAMAKSNGPKMGKILKQLDLTSEQQADIDAIRAAQKEQGEAQREAMQTARESHKAAMQALMTNETFDENEAIRLLDEKSAQKQANALARMRSHHAIMQVLTPAQQEQFLELMEQQRKKGSKKGKGKKNDK